MRHVCVGVVCFLCEPVVINGALPRVLQPDDDLSRPHHTMAAAQCTVPHGGAVSPDGFYCAAFPLGKLGPESCCEVLTVHVSWFDSVTPRNLGFSTPLYFPPQVCGGRSVSPEVDHHLLSFGRC